MMCGFMQLATLQFERKLQKCIRMGITILKLLFVEVYHQIYGQKSCFAAPLAHPHKTKFPTVYPAFPNENFEYSYPLSFCFTARGLWVCGQKAEFSAIKIICPNLLAK